MHTGFQSKVWLQREDKNHESHLKIDFKYVLCEMEGIIPVFADSFVFCLVK